MQNCCFLWFIPHIGSFHCAKKKDTTEAYRFLIVLTDSRCYRKCESCHDANFDLTNDIGVVTMTASTATIDKIGIMTSFSFQWMWEFIPSSFFSCVLHACPWPWRPWVHVSALRWPRYLPGQPQWCKWLWGPLSGCKQLPRIDVLSWWHERMLWLL